MLYYTPDAMFPKIVKAYAEQGFKVDLGNPSRLYATLINSGTGRTMETGGGLAIADVMLFTGLSRAFSPEATFVIGNAFGLSTFVLAELFPNSLIDVIDAESEGSDNASGSSITRRIGSRHYPNVQLTSGYSPQDVRKAARAARYQLAFVDGLHTNDQMQMDFDGILPMLADDCVVVFHDVALFRMLPAWGVIKKSAEQIGFKGFELPWTPFGLSVISRNAAVSEYLSLISASFGPHRYHLGVTSPPAGLPRVLSKSPIELLQSAKRRLMSK